MILNDIYNVLDTISPFALQEDWDNSGLNVGAFGDEVLHIVVSLDVDEALIDTLDANTLIITHHPLIFGKLKRVDYATYPANLIQKMVKKDISLIAMHTNFDKSHLNDYVFNEVLGFQGESQNFIATAQVSMHFEDLVALIKKKFSLTHLACVQTKEEIGSIALTTGAGGSLIPYVNADVFLTGDIKYHDAMMAKSLGLSLIDISHYASERFFATIMLECLKKASIKAIITNSKNPFTDY